MFPFLVYFDFAVRGLKWVLKRLFGLCKINIFTESNTSVQCNINTWIGTYKHLNITDYRIIEVAQKCKILGKHTWHFETAI